MTSCSAYDIDKYYKIIKTIDKVYRPFSGKFVTLSQTIILIIISIPKHGK